MPPPVAETVQVIPGSELIWKITPRPENSAKVRGGNGQGNSGRFQLIWNLSLAVLRVFHVCHAAK